MAAHPSNPREREIFEQALDLESLEERRGYVQRVCANDSELRARLLALLLAYDEAGAFLPDPPSADSKRSSMARASDDSVPGDRIGRYKLLQKAGEGGCGVVYVAEQEEPVCRLVALKVIKLGMDTKSVIARFEAERQALALMDHPNIARVLDAGATETGRPYFVMELVRGIKITDYCDQHALATRDRLDLFIKVCQAIQHAHQKGVIHRDIKPSNILVTLHDGPAAAGVPKVIDFGIAKATTNQRLTDKTIFTALEQFMGTPAYMSPEQAEMSGLDIDTRCDIYSLGVLLYELLAGKTPFDAKELLASGLDEMRRTIREREPVRPSVKVSQTLVETELRRAEPPSSETTGAKPETKAFSRRLPPTKELVQLLRGDLDWIVMKCLEKDRARRYETANGLASDIQRHLNDETVLARPPSAAYRFQKMVRRNKLAVAAAASVATALVLGVVASTGQAIRATRASASEAVHRRLAEAQRNVAVEQRKLADMQVALQAWDEGDLQRADGLIEGSRPEPDQPPGFAWRYLKKLCQDQSIETFRSPNGHYRSAQFLAGNLLLLSDKKSIILRDISGRKEQVLLTDGDGIWNVALCSGNTNLLATVTDDGRIKIWDLPGRRVQVELEGHPRVPPGAADTLHNVVSFSPDGRWLASIIADNAVKLWDVTAKNPKPVRTIRRYSDRGSGAIFSRDGKLLFSSGSEPVLRAWDVATGAEEGDPLEAHKGWLYALAISPDGLRLASGGADSTPIVWNAISRRREARFLGHFAAVMALAFSPDQQILASGGRDQTIRLWDLNTGQPLSLLRGHHATGRSLSFSSDGQSLASQSEDGLVKLWRVNPSPEDSPLLGGREVVLSSDGRHLASIGPQSGVYLWDLSQRSSTLLRGHTSFVVGVAFSPDGRILATSSHDQTVKLWDVNDHQAVATLTNGFPAGTLAFSPDGRTLIVGGSKFPFLVGDRGGLQFWDVPSRQATGTLSGVTSNIVEIALSPNGSVLATAHNAGPVSLWDTQTRRLLHQFAEQFGSSVLSLAFSPTEPLLAAGDWGGNIVFYNIATMATVRLPLKAHTKRVTSLAFSPDGRTLASAGEGGGLKLWNVAMRQVALILKGHVGLVTGIAFSRDGNFMASSGLDGTVRFWPAATPPETEATAQLKKDTAAQ